MKAFRAIAIAGLVAGTLDITAAITYWYLKIGMAPALLLRRIAGGLLGPSAAKGGTGIALLGLACHFTIAFGATTVFYLLSRGIPFLLDHPVISGALYGIAVYCFMNIVVLPLSAIHFKPMNAFTAPALAWGIPVHMVCVGMGIAVTMRLVTR